MSELGGGRGHIARLSAVASIAKALGYSTVLAIRAENRFDRTQSGGPFDRVLEGPRFPRLKNVPPIFQVAGLAATLARVGFVDHCVITPILAQWQALLSELNPTIVVGDFAPYARLASLGRVPFLMVGSGYTLPTSEGLLPFPQSDARRDPSQLINHILKTVNESLFASDEGPIEDPSLCLRGDWNAVACVPLLDPTAGRHPKEYFGPFEDFPPEQTRSTNERKIYVYLHSLSEQDLREIDSLANAGYSIDMYCDGLSDEHPKRASKLATPRSLSEIVKNYGCVLHQGGLGLSTFCLQAAIPQFLLPKHTEASLTAKKLRAIGCAAVLTSRSAEQGANSSVSEFQQLLEPASTKARREIAVETRDWIKRHDWRKRLNAILTSS